MHSLRACSVIGHYKDYFHHGWAGTACTLYVIWGPSKINFWHSVGHTVMYIHTSHEGAISRFADCVVHGVMRRELDVKWGPIVIFQIVWEKIYQLLTFGICEWMVLSLFWTCGNMIMIYCLLSRRALCVTLFFFFSACCRIWSWFLLQGWRVDCSVSKPSV